MLKINGYKVFLLEMQILLHRTTAPPTIQFQKIKSSSRETKILQNKMAATSTCDGNPIASKIPASNNCSINGGFEDMWLQSLQKNKMATTMTRDFRVRKKNKMAANMAHDFRKGGHNDTWL